MANYTRTTTVDHGPSGDSVEQAVIDVDTDLTGVIAAYNAHDTATTSVHGCTGAATGTGALVRATSPTLVTPALGTPSAGVITNCTGSPTLTAPALGTPASGTLTSCTGLPMTTGVTGTLPVANGGTGVTSSTGTVAVVLSTSPTLVTPLLGTPTSGTLTNCTGLPLTTGVTGTLPVANGGTGVTSSTGTVAVVLSTSPTLVTPLLGTPTSGTLTNCTGLPISTGVSGLGSNVATFLATPSSANLASAVTDETGSGALVFATSPTLVTPAFTLGSDADGDMYYRASSALARLAKGAANLKLFMNAGATAPEWAVGIKLVATTRAHDAASGDQAITGAGFKPSAALVMAEGSTGKEVSIGIMDASLDNCLCLYENVSGTAGDWVIAAEPISMYEAAGKYQLAVWKSFDADGMTITWTRTGVTAGGTINLSILFIR